MGVPVREMRGREGVEDVVITRTETMQCKQPYKVLCSTCTGSNLSGCNLGGERVVRENAPIRTGCGKISLSFTPNLFLFFFALF